MVCFVSPRSRMNIIGHYKYFTNLIAKMTSLIMAPSPNFQYFVAISGAGSLLHIGNFPSSIFWRISE